MDRDKAVEYDMTDPLVVQTLRDTRAEILGRIAAYEAQIAQAKHDLAHVNATIRLFTEPEKQRARYLVSHGFFKKGEIADICAQHLSVEGELTTRELAERVMAERGLDVTDATLRNSVVFKVVQALRHAKRRRLVRMLEKQKGMCIWAAGDAFMLRVANNPSSHG
jgi:multidrug resistance efflux pump